MPVVSREIVGKRGLWYSELAYWKKGSAEKL
jgi:hypothetical protein